MNLSINTSSELINEYIPPNAPTHNRRPSNNQCNNNIIIPCLDTTLQPSIDAPIEPLAPKNKRLRCIFNFNEITDEDDEKSI